MCEQLSVCSHAGCVRVKAAAEEEEKEEDGESLFLQDEGENMHKKREGRGSYMDDIPYLFSVVQLRQ